MNNITTPTGEEPQRRLRLPNQRENEMFGVVIGLMGGSRMKVACKDGKERLCRIPGRMKNTIWVKEGDVVVLRPWEIQGEKRADIVYRYNPMQARMLKEKGFI